LDDDGIERLMMAMWNVGVSFDEMKEAMRICCLL
jgi:hypothetical protein